MAKKQPTNQIKLDHIQNSERALISACLNNEDDLEIILNEVKPNDFFDEELRIIYKAIFHIFNENKKVNDITLIDLFNKNEQYVLEDYRNKILLIKSENEYSMNLEEHIDIVTQASIKRQLDQYFSTVIENPIDPLNFGSAIYSIQQKVMEITTIRNAKDSRKLDEIIKEYDQKINEIQVNGISSSGVSSGLENIDQYLNGFQSGSLVVVAARPGMGKTAIAINFLLQAAKDAYENNNKDENYDKKPEVCVMFSLEMGGDEILKRIYAIESNLQMRNFMENTYSNDDQVTYERTKDHLAKLPIIINDGSDTTIADIQMQLKRISTNYKIRLVVVDYLQLVKSPKNTNLNAMNRQQEVALISRTLKALARNKDIDTPIIALCQLSRKAEERNTRPLLSDLRESGAIEQDADIVAFLSPEGDQEDENVKDISKAISKREKYLNDPEIIVEFIIAKHRNGQTGIAKLKFNKTQGKFINI